MTVPSLLSVFLCALAAVPVFAADWPPITPAELALKAPKIDPNADAEALMWDVRITDSDERAELQTVLVHHVRIKIFTERGRDAHSKVELPYIDSRRVRDIEGRTIAPNGTITELRNQDVFDRTIIEGDGIKLRVKSFVLPAVVPGSIIDYTWREIRDDSLAQNLELPLQRDIPTHEVRYHLKPLSLRELGYQMRTEWYNVTQRPEQVREGNNYTAFVSRNVPALKTEKHMPPELAVKPWMLVYYADLADVNKAPEKFWADYAKSAFNAFKPQLRATNEMRQAIAELKKSTAMPTIEDLVALVRARVKRDDTDTAGLGASKFNKLASDALKQGRGSGPDQTLLVAALAPMAGIDARLALLPDRTEFISGPAMRQPHFIRHLAVAVPERAGGWRFVDPANEHARGGFLAWENDGQYALLLDEKTPEFVQPGVSAPENSLRKRTATLTLADDGTLSGDMVVEYHGHAATERREFDDDETPTDRERLFVEGLVRRWPGAVVSNVSFQYLDNPEQPYTVRFSVRLPGYAQRTGSRLFVQPALWQKGADAMFTDPSRTHSVLFPYAYREEDVLAVTLPEGFQLEQADGPEPTFFDGGTGFYNAKIAADGRRVTYTRNLTVGGQGKISHAAQAYPALKAFFDAVRRIDGYTMTLRRPAASGQ